MKKNINDVLILFQSGDSQKALVEIRKLIKKTGNTLEGLALMADIQKSMGKLDSAILNYKKALAYSSDQQQSATVLYNLGLCFQQLDQYEEAISAYKESIRCDAGFALSAFNLANLYLQSDYNNEAIDCFQKVISSDKEEHTIPYQLKQKSYAALSRLTQYNFSDEDIHNLFKMIESKELTSDDGRSHCYFALANWFDKTGKYQSALEFYIQANELRQVQNGYTVSNDIEYIDSVIQKFSEKRVDELQLDKEHKLQSRPIFIVGMPRSGSTLLESRLENKSAIKALGELPCFSEAIISVLNNKDVGAHFGDAINQLQMADICYLRDNYIKSVNSLHDGALYYIDKMPENFAYLGFILLAFPEAKIIHTVRHPAAVIWSCYQTDFGQAHAYSNSIETLIQYYSGYERLMHHWKSIFKDRIFDLSYEAFVSDPNNEMAKLMEYLAIENSGNTASKILNDSNYRVKTASLHQVREPLHNKAIDKWKNYSEFLLPVQDAFSEN